MACTGGVVEDKLRRMPTTATATTAAAAAAAAAAFKLNSICSSQPLSIQPVVFFLIRIFSCPQIGDLVTDHSLTVKPFYFWH